jgi:predicted RNA binding protein YcfA (HicA-like mRNA interferase family)
MNGYYQPLIQILKLAGFVYLRQGKGSHDSRAQKAEP